MCSHLGSLRYWMGTISMLLSSCLFPFSLWHQAPFMIINHDLQELCLLSQRYQVLSVSPWKWYQSPLLHFQTGRLLEIVDENGLNLEIKALKLLNMVLGWLNYFQSILLNSSKIELRADYILTKKLFKLTCLILLNGFSFVNIRDSVF